VRKKQRRGCTAAPQFLFVPLAIDDFSFEKGNLTREHIRFWGRRLVRASAGPGRWAEEAN
jgi:hypothetical protein